MKVIVNFGEKKVVVPCGIDGEISIRELINIATAKYCKLVRKTYSITTIYSKKRKKTK